MRFDKMTLKAQEALQESQTLARAYGHPEIRPLHLTVAEERALVQFLESLSDDPTVIEPPARVPSGLPVGGRY